MRLAALDSCRAPALCVILVLAPERTKYKNDLIEGSLPHPPSPVVLDIIVDTVPCIWT